jgi:hypothetical protein
MSFAYFDEFEAESSQTDFAKLYWYWKVYEELFAIFSQIGFIDMLSLWLLKWSYGCANEKFDLKGANKITGNIKVYNNVIAQFGNFAQNTLQNLDYETLSRFELQCEHR